MRAEKRDANERELVDVMTALGCSVERLPGGNGRPDLLIGFRGHTLLVEVKVLGEGLNKLQKKFHATWKGATIHVVSTTQQVIEIIHQHGRHYGTRTTDAPRT